MTSHHLCRVGVFFLALLGLWCAPQRVAAADEQIQIVRSVEDPDVTPNTSLCDSASFIPTVVFGASLFDANTRSSDGVLLDNRGHKLGSGTACARIVSLAVGDIAPILTEFNIGGQTVVGEGECVITTNTVPVAGLITATCAVPIDAAPGIAGGLASSNSVFNPFLLPGFKTGSIWTLHLYGD